MCGLTYVCVYLCMGEFIYGFAGSRAKGCAKKYLQNQKSRKIMASLSSSVLFRCVSVSSHVIVSLSLYSVVDRFRYLFSVFFCRVCKCVGMVLLLLC